MSSAYAVSWRGATWLALLLVSWGLFAGTASPQTTSRQGVLVRIVGPIGPAAADYVARSIDRAGDAGAALIVLRIDTPGGLDSSMRVIVQKILASPIPVIGHVAPSGARAASAGTYILQATHVAAMAPGTDLGAATPVQIGGGLLPTPKRGDEDGETDRAERPPSPGDKAVSEAVAYIRSLAQLRGRNVEWAERAVREAASLSADDALAEGVIDIVAVDTPALLTKLDGMRVTLPSGEVVLDTSNIAMEAWDPDWRTELLSVLTNPNVAYFLLLVGFYGILLEFYSPGALVPGVTGVISLLLAFYALQLLPVDYAGLALILAGVGLMAAEAFVPSFGALGIGGAVAFVIGSVMLIDTDVPGFQVSRTLIGSIAAISAAIFLAVMMFMLRAHRRAVVTGPEELEASVARVIDWDGPVGHVRVHGEIWKARADKPFKPGEPARVVGLDGLTLSVEPTDSLAPMEDER